VYGVTLNIQTGIPIKHVLASLHERVWTNPGLLMPISHRRRAQDKTVLSCLVRVCGVN